MTRRQAELLIKIQHLLNDKPRFGPRDRRLPFDSYSVASELNALLEKSGYDTAARAKVIGDLRR